MLLYSVTTVTLLFPRMLLLGYSLDTKVDCYCIPYRQRLLCAIQIRETRVANDVFMEPITGVDKINKQRWKLVRFLITSHFLVQHAYSRIEMLNMWRTRRRLYSV